MKFVQLNEATFDTFAYEHAYGSIFQSSAWAHTKDNWDAYYVGVEDKELVAAGLVLVREIKLGICFGYMPRGPLMDMKNTEVKDFFFKELVKFLRGKKVVLCKYDPYVSITKLALEDRELIEQQKDEQLVALYKARDAKFTGYTLLIEESIQPRIQLSYPLGEVFDERIPKKTMKKVRASLNKGVVIKEEHDASNLMKMVNKTEQRHQIHLRNETYFNKILNNFKDNAVVLSAYLEEQLVSSCLLVMSKTTVEILYSGYDDEFKHCNSTYPLRHAALKYGKEHGRTFFNFGGVEGTMDDGLTMFKKSFNPEIEVFLGEYDLMVYPLVSNVSSLLFNKLKSHINL
ncbi:MAG: peptidoglycan bridge formation glycyltransferase FemA/FemB family protein [Erysipelotrichaceae bacterium]|nr:peptidoglycan bridge formation glycyltransferase FemA/FemB family protein [Erysipelotrichaceae bacterium]